MVVASKTEPRQLNRLSFPILLPRGIMLSQEVVNSFPLDKFRDLLEKSTLGLSFLYVVTGIAQRV